MLGRFLSSLFRRPKPQPASRADIDSGGRPIAIGIAGPTVGRALEGATRALGELLAEHGYHYHEVDGTQPGAIAGVADLLAVNDVAFGFGMAGFGGLAEIWAPTGTPFFKLFGDHPAYFLERHVEQAPSIISLYAYAEHWNFQRRYIARGNVNGVLTPTALDIVPRGSVDAERKAQGTVLFLKNGNDPAELEALWRARLPPGLARGLLELGELLRADLAGANVEAIEAAIAGYFLDKGIDVSRNVRLFSLHIAQLDDYVRRLKSTMIAQALLDCPVEVHGYNWNHVKFDGRRAKHVPLADYALSRSLMSDALAVIDMSPNTNSFPHDRVLRAFGRFTLCLTNENEWLLRNLPFHDRYTFEFRADSIRELVERVFEDRKGFVEIGMQLGDRLAAEHPPAKVVSHLQSLAEQVRIGCAASPQLQNYFVWPR